jgi:lipoprotein-anchoring transpeptidase ErfK/SrfK
MNGTPQSDAPEGEIRRSDRRTERRRPRWLWPVAAGLVVAIAAGVFLAVEGSRAVAVDAISPADGSMLSAQPVTISCSLSHLTPGEGTLALTIDGQSVPAADLQVKPGLVQASVPLDEGRHTARLVYESGNLFSGHLEREWSFGVDTTAPAVTVAAPGAFPLLTTRSSDLALALTEAADVVLTLDGGVVSVDASGAPQGPVKATVVADEGVHALALTATDAAGNVITQRWDLRVDYSAPVVTAKGLPAEDVWNSDNSVSGILTVADRFPESLQVSATLDGTGLALEDKSSASAGSEATSAPGGATPGGAAAPGTHAYAFSTGTLAEGTHQIQVSATDLAGHATTFTRDFLVDTTGTFGQRTLKTGAIGADVAQLQRILAIKGTYAGKADGQFGPATAAAVQAFNTQHGLDGGQVVTADTLKYLLGSIRIDLSERKLYLYGGDGKVVKTYRVAVGMPKYPTPTGSFRIIKKEVDPTWDPPNSDWAAGMGPIPPGPGNPLGTRWMGLNSPGIGIHGTYASSSIGTAASHGCIRMRVHEAEDLFDRVYVGSPVEIVK